MTKKEETIGVFDSGVGGLTVVKALAAVLPNERFTYYGDVAHLPYGDKSPEAIRGYLKKVIGFFLAQNVKIIVIACNSASAVLNEELKALCGDTPLFEVITPAVNAALEASRYKRVGVIGTKTTINAHVYLNKLLEKAPDAIVVEKATPLLVPIIENEPADGPLARAVVEAYLSDTGFRVIDTLILGCTHYPLLSPVFEDYFQKNFDHPVKIISSSYTTGAHVAQALHSLQLTAESESRHENRFFVSDYTPNFQQIAKLFFGPNLRLTYMPFETLG